MANETPRPDATPDALFARYRQTRDPAALGALFDAAAPGLFRLAVSLTPDASRAEDSLQETFLFALEEADRWDPARPVVPWLMTVLRFKVKEGRRRDARTPDPLRLDRAPDPDDPAALAESAEERERLYEAMRRLPEPYRGVALLRWRYGHEPAEIADIRGEPPGTVWSILHRAVRKLKVEMGAMPALLLAFRPERGLDGVRRALLRRAAAKAAASAAVGAGAAAAGVVTVTTMGGFLMANKAIVAVAAILLLGGAGWIASRPAAGPPPANPSVEMASGARPPGLAAPGPASAPVEAPPADEPGSPVDLSKCSRELDLFGIVVDGKGTPVAGAELKTLQRPWRRVASVQAEFNRTVDGPSSRSAPDGTFRIRLRRAEVVDLVVTALGFPERVLAQCPAGERLRVVLSEGAALAVTARDEEGNPLLGVDIRIRSYPLFRSLQPSGRTDAEGKCVLSGLPPGMTIVEFSAEGRASLRSPANVNLPESGKAELAIVLPKGRVLAGRVQDAATGKPIAGARVGSGPLLDTAVTTDADGRYEFRGWPKSDERDLVAEAGGYGRLAVLVEKEDGIDFALSEGDEVVGRILGPDGAPVSEAPVLVYGAAPRGGGGRQVDMLLAMSGPDGRFRVGGVNHAFGHQVLIAPPGLGRLDTEVPPRAGGPGTIDLGDLQAPAARSVAGLVLDGAGKPMPGIEVRLNPGGDPPQSPLGLPERRRTDDLGRFLFPDVSPGPWRAESRGELRLSKSVIVPEDRDLEGVILEPAPPPKPPAGQGRLRVVVRGTAGEPLAGIPVAVIGIDRNLIASRPSGPDGTVAFPEVSAVRVLIQARETPPFGKPPKFLSPSPALASPSDGDFVVTLREAAYIKGRVVGPDGTPLQGVCVMVKGPDIYVETAWTDSSGDFILAAEAGAETVLTLRKLRLPGKNNEGTSETGLRIEPRTVVAPADGIILEAHEIAGGKSLTVRVLDLDGQPVPMCSVMGGGSSKDGSFPYTGADGRVELTGLMEEPTRIAVGTPNFSPQAPYNLPADSVAPEPVTVTPAGQEIVLRLRKGSPRSGLVLDGEGRPVERALVRLQSADATLSQGVWTDAAGRFTVWVAPGQKLMSATASFGLGPKGPTHTAILEGADIPAEGDIILRLEPWNPR